MRRLESSINQMNVMCVMIFMNGLMLILRGISTALVPGAIFQWAGENRLFSAYAANMGRD
jgi:hypothetical protein